MVQWWQAWGRWAALAAASVLASAVLFVVFCLFTPPGHAVLARLVTPLTGDAVAISGLSGTLPNHLRAQHVELRDSAGPWLRAEGVTLDWRLLALLGDRVDVRNVRVERVVVLRNKVPSKSTSTTTTKVDVDHLSIGRIELNRSVLGRSAVLAASGSLHYLSRHDVAADLAIRRLDGDGRYDVHASIIHDVAVGTITANEPGNGIAGSVLGLPDFGPVSLDIRAAAQGTLNTIRFKADAGLLDIFGGGTIDLSVNRADIDFSAVAPAMNPGAQLSWSALTAKGHIHGTFERPDLNADLKLTDLNIGGARIADAHAQVTGNGGVADLKLTATGLRVPGSNPGAFAAFPAVLSAQVNLVDRTHPVHFTVDHRLLKVAGQVTAGGAIAGSISAQTPSLGAVAALAGIPLDGAAKLTVSFAQRDAGMNVRVNARIAARGDGALAKLLGPRAKLAADATVRDAQNALLSASLEGAAASAKFGGQMANGAADFEGDLAISDLSRAVANLEGSLKLHVRLRGPLDNIALAVNGNAFAATKGMAKQQVAILARAAGLPKLKTGSVHLAGSFDGSPLKLHADVANAGANAMKITLANSSWRSASANGTVVIADARPSGTLTVRVARLADLSALVGTPLAGSVDAKADFRSSAAAIRATATGMESGATHIDRLDLQGTVTDPLGKPSLSLNLSVPQLAASGMTGSLNARVDGPLQSLDLRVTSAFKTSGGQDFSVATDAAINTVAKHVVFNRFEGVWRDQSVGLAAPATFDYGGADMTFAATFVGGKSAARLTVSGSLPAKAGRSMNVHANGTADLAVIASGLAAVGQSIRGKIALNVSVTGTSAKPQVQGSATIVGGQLNDFQHGVSLSNIEATAQAQGSAIRLTSFKATAGPGTITGMGLVDLSAPGTPVDITFKASNARPITSDLMTANMDCDLALRGKLSQRVVLSGTLRIRRGNINIPEKFPSQVATLNVRRTHQPPPPPPPGAARMALDLSVTSPGQIFVRGRGLEAEFQGNLKVAGTTQDPHVLGALEMRRGTFSLASATLTFQSGKIGFAGQTLRNSLDPTLDFVAQSEANGITATLKVTGTAAQPKIELSSTPQMPQDEILAQLLFQQSAKSLSAMQLASVAQAAATLSGGGSGFDPVGSIRKSLGLDRLAVGSTQDTAGSKGSTTVEAGKYILRNVYLGARQDISGGTRALVQVDLTKHLKAQATVNTGPRPAASTSTPLQDNGDSIGLSYQFEY